METGCVVKGVKTAAGKIAVELCSNGYTKLGSFIPCRSGWIVQRTQRWPLVAAAAVVAAALLMSGTAVPCATAVVSAVASDFIAVATADVGRIDRDTPGAPISTEMRKLEATNQVILSSSSTTQGIEPPEVNL